MNRVQVHYQEHRVGTLAQARGGIFFEYDPAFIVTGHELSPLHLPLSPGLLMREKVPSVALPGLFDDSLPDAWGERLMLEWFRRQGTPAHSVTPLMKLSYVGARGMGALIYEPELQPTARDAGVSLKELHEAAMQIERAGPIDLDVLAEVGSSAGGAHAKAVIGLPRAAAGDVLAGAGDLPSSHEAWLVKFDTSRDATAGVMEHAYALMAQAAGVDMPPTRLLETNHARAVRRHFAVQRFDRAGNARTHHHTLSGLCHMAGGDLSYETLLRVTRRVTRDEREVWRAFRRAVFNVLASNRDDHGKNHGFLYREREWSLGPAYDLTFRSPRQLPERGMSIGGERAGAGRAHLLKLAESETLDRRAALTIIDEVAAAIADWRTFADRAKVPATLAAEVAFALSIQARV